MKRVVHFIIWFINRCVLPLFLMTPLWGYAQGMIVRGAVRDAITGEGLEGATLLILNSESDTLTSVRAGIPLTYVDNGDGSKRGYKDKNSGAAFEFIAPVDGIYTIHVDKQGYASVSIDVEVAPKSRNKPLKLADILLLPKARELKDVTVTGTKLKVYHNGDTVVYDAGAFVVDNRSMLEDLVKMLPGVELRDGKIFANGRYVENIVIGGRDFMQSSPEQIMRMLPAYVVDKLKFYDKSGERSKTMGRDMDDKSYVMDVSMKRDYHGAWFGYAGAGGGTKRRWSLTDLTMLYDDRQALTLSADANNVGEARELSQIATATETYGDRELRDMHSEIGYSYHPSERMKLGARAAVKHRDTGQASEQAYSANIAAPDNIFRRTVSDSDLRDNTYSGGFSMSLRPHGGVYTTLSYNVNYGKNAGEERSTALTSNTDTRTTDSLITALLSQTPPSVAGVTNVYSDRSSSEGRKWAHDVAAEAHIACGDNLLRVKGALNSGNTSSERYRKFHSRLFEEGMLDTRLDNTFSTHNSRVKADALATYDINYADNTDRRGIFTPFYSFRWTKDRDRRRVLNENPTDEAENTFAAANSRRILVSTGTHSLGAGLKHELRLTSGRWLTLSARIAAALEHTVASCVTAGGTSEVGRDFVLLHPEFGLKWCAVADDRQGSDGALELKCQMEQTPPNGADLPDFTDSSDPMNIISGNPGLRKQTALDATLGFRRYFGRWRTTLYTELRLRGIRDALGFRSVYDESSGVRRTQPVNAESWRRVSLELGYVRPLMYDQTMWLNLSVEGGVTRCADLVSTSQNLTQYPYMSIGDYSTRLSVRYNTKNRKIGGSYSLSLHGSALTRASSPGSSLCDVGNTVSIDLKLPADISAKATCAMVSRFGYAMPSLNKTVALLNAEIRKSFMKGKLNMTLSANDLLRQRAHVSYTIDGEGSTETVKTRYTPSYVMLSVRYNWAHTKNRKPK